MRYIYIYRMLIFTIEPLINTFQRCGMCFCKKQVDFNPSASIHIMVFSWLVVSLESS